ncbi:MAG TPA: prolipoprotein diacylglyceryl transferase [Armatimonadota bacterium]|jgi:phosphatidylglycerol:prolipoprotein diacylglycerol transferase|nr:prolipoprotein diacylglyceryl transferase [Armatimonadota bacterium]HPO73626.1 prolipoprotein diacylglyceryl transferase [Armatimonadota bacterium]HPT98433.1 prolipoprotein diacylglyceryl transferase [Armatimonadota bacterium]
MRPILFHIPVIPVAGWIALVAVFFGLSAYWGLRDIEAEGLSPEERGRRRSGMLAAHAVLFAIAAALLWHFQAAIAHPLPVRAYGFMLMTGFAAGLLYLKRASRGTALPPEGVVDLILGLLLVAIISSRFLFVLLQWESYSDDWREWFRVWEGGLSFHGGLGGGILFVVWYARRYGLRFWWLADLIAPGLALGYAFARVGCFLNGCCYGRPTSLPWAVQFHDPPLSTHLTPPSHPVQLYAVIANLALFGILAHVWRRKRYDGQIAGLYLILYSVYRFVAEGFRKGVTGNLFALGMTEAQWASLAIAAAGVALMVTMRKQATEGGPDPSGRSASRQPAALGKEQPAHGSTKRRAKKRK